jgi:hypothetical protein
MAREARPSRRESAEYIALGNTSVLCGYEGVKNNRLLFDESIVAMNKVDKAVSSIIASDAL